MIPSPPIGSIAIRVSFCGSLFLRIRLQKQRPTNFLFFLGSAHRFAPAYAKASARWPLSSAPNPTLSSACPRTSRMRCFRFVGDGFFDPLSDHFSAHTLAETRSHKQSIFLGSAHRFAPAYAKASARWPLSSAPTPFFSLSVVLRDTGTRLQCNRSAASIF